MRHGRRDRAKMEKYGSIRPRRHRRQAGTKVQPRRGAVVGGKSNCIEV